MKRIQKLVQRFSVAIWVLLGFSLAQTARGEATAAVTGGTVVTNNGYCICTFTNNGSFTVSGGSLGCDVLIVAGGGGGGERIGGGGGAGGLIFTNLAVSGAYSVTVGVGGAKSTSQSSTGGNGSNSWFGPIMATGGGGGGSYNNLSGNNGGSGGGGPGYGMSAGAGLAGQGHAGGVYTANYSAGGGGGAGTAGTNAAAAVGGAGGLGRDFSGYFGAGVGQAGWFAGGGGGCAYNGGSAATTGLGGQGGGGSGAVTAVSAAGSGMANTGGGGGGGDSWTGAAGSSGSGPNTRPPGAGGSGIVIVRYNPDTPYVANVAGSVLPKNTSASLVGALQANGASPATVYLYWSTTDGTTNASVWTAGGSVRNLGAFADGTTFTNVLTGLTLGKTYYWNYCASNSAAVVWGATAGSPSFMTPGGVILYASWNYQAAIHCSGYHKPETLTNFPALVVLGTNIAGFAYSQFLSGSNDLAFTMGTNTLNYEIDTWNPNGLSYVWVQLPTLTNNSTFTAWWGGLGQTAPACTTNGATWDGTFTNVWHLSGNANEVQGRNNGTLSGSPGTTNGVVGGGYNFNGSSEIRLKVDALIDFSASVWMKANDAGGSDGSAWYYDPGLIGCDQSGQENDWGVGWENQKIMFGSGPVDSSKVLTANQFSINAWHHVFVTRRNSDGYVLLYVDGVLAGSGTGNAGSRNNGTYMALGAETDGGHYFNGGLDEARIDTVIRSSNWVWACYLNQASNGVFNNYGAAALSNPVVGSVIFFR